jgi:precorrin-2/cobalt-factor-2 C20-methyltransferase
MLRRLITGPPEDLPLSIIDPPVPAGLTVVGVGPGDPDLLTLAAVRAIELAQVVAMPVAGEGIESMAAAIASAWIRPDQRRLPLVFPMVEAADPRRDAWHRAAAAIASEVEQGHAVVLLCEGDASLFATASYVLLALQQRHPGCPVAVVPGITAISAAAAAAAWPLALQQDQLLVMPCPDQPEDLASALEQAAVQSRVLALLKLGRRWRWVRPLLEQQRLLAGALFAERVGWPDQWVQPAEAMPAGERPYFSLLLIRQGWPSVLP